MSEAQTPPPDQEPFDLETEPLDDPGFWGRDWGGDGSDLNRPNRAHILAALRPNTEPYTPPVDGLLHIGDIRKPDAEEKRSALAIRQEHLPDLVRMARDRALHTGDSESDEVWAPLNAIAAMRGLDISGVVADLMPLFDINDDWIDNELPELLAEAGEAALAPVRAYLEDNTRWAFGHAFAMDVLEKFPASHPELREQSVEMLSDVLRNAERYHEITVTSAMGALVELDAVEALPLIRRAFERGQIDETVYGPWDHVLGEMGVEPEEDDPLVEESRRRFEERREQFFPEAKRRELLDALDRFADRPGAFAELAASRANADASRALPPPRPATALSPGQMKARKQKNRRKAEAASRKANRKKRR